MVLAEERKGRGSLGELFKSSTLYGAHNIGGKLVFLVRRVRKRKREEIYEPERKKKGAMFASNENLNSLSSKRTAAKYRDDARKGVHRVRLNKKKRGGRRGGEKEYTPGEAG